MRIGLRIAFIALGLSLNTAASAEDPCSLTTQGMDLTPAEVSFLEEKLERDPHDSVSRTKLLGYYYQQIEDRSAQEKHANHVLWLIRNNPEAAVLGISEGTVEPWRSAHRYADARKAWLEEIERDPSNTTLLDHAATAFTPHALELATDLLQRAQSLDGSNPKWAEQLGQLHMLDAMRPPGTTKQRIAGKALAQLERAFALSEGSARGFLVVDLAKAAYAAGKHEQAREYAESALKDNGEGWNQGKRTHHGNVILGRIALAEGNIEEARYRLVAAATTHGSPQLDSFGPDMTLAKELLDAGEKEVVLNYFELCSGFWEMGQEELADWTALVKAGRMPDFEGSLEF